MSRADIPQVRNSISNKADGLPIKTVWEVGRYGYCIGLKIRRSWFDTNTSHSSLGGFSESLYNSVTARLRKRDDPLKKLNGVGLRKSAHIVCD